LTCANSLLQSINDMKPKYTLMQFLESDLLINLTEHELPPEHVVKTLIDENRQVLKQQQEDRERRLIVKIEAETKADVCRVLQLAKEQHGPNAVEWTSVMTATRVQTLREYEKEMNTPAASSKTTRSHVTLD
uniref:Ubiquitinyl hydrolase 1 n=1 Tax=Steinernema glaseri TaxID=37863 RepID=A0A1I7XZ75_9BILA